ncbi:hypothetical protein [Bradyrhizobium sp. CER78]|uniref:hypothetical protein n=1 Tax=Bradyrhizobium sp. CER78 TaxID=3039162 RepID=UPI002449B2D3|nr:hypothetical protein [Bradyrhizobium sp. CER78]MDH2379877.1 hypothetical protein [Bradyrhizobium sp. CER78]
MKPITILVLSLSFLTYHRVALGQPFRCPVCRAVLPYGHCPEGGIGTVLQHGIAFSGTVVAAKPIDCGVQITAEVTRSSPPSLSAVIKIDVGPCSIWAGKIGDPINAVVSTEPEPSGAYLAFGYCGESR